MAKKEPESCLVSACSTCTFSKCLVDTLSHGDSRYLRFIAVGALKDIGMEAKMIGSIIGVTPNHIYKILREDWGDYLDS